MIMATPREARIIDASRYSPLSVARLTPCTLLGVSWRCVPRSREFARSRRRNRTDPSRQCQPTYRRIPKVGSDRVTVHVLPLRWRHRSPFLVIPTQNHPSPQSRLCAIWAKSCGSLNSYCLTGANPPVTGTPKTPCPLLEAQGRPLSCAAPQPGMTGHGARPFRSAHCAVPWRADHFRCGIARSRCRAIPRPRLSVAEGASGARRIGLRAATRAGDAVLRRGQRIPKRVARHRPLPRGGRDSQRRPGTPVVSPLILGKPSDPGYVVVARRMGSTISIVLVVRGGVDQQPLPTILALGLRPAFADASRGRQGAWRHRSRAGNR